jgi:PAS domain S-box-containing protein
VVSGRHDNKRRPAGDAGRARLRDVVNATIVDALPSAVALLDERGVVTSVNAAWVRSAIDRPHDPLVAEPGTDYRTVLDLVAADPTRRALADALRGVLAGGAARASVDHSPTDAEADWFTVRAMAVDVDGRRGTVLAIDDVSALHHALERWHATFSDAAVPTILLDEHAIVVDANAAFAELLRTDVARAIRRPALEVVHPDDHDVVRERVARAVAGDRDVDPLEIRLLRADGTIATVEVRPAQLAPGKRPTVVQLIDLTQQRRAETRLALQRELLELVASGTPLADVAAAVALNVPRAVDGAFGAVVLAGGAPYLPPGVTTAALGGGWSVPVDRSRAVLGDVVVVPSRPGLLPEPDELDAAEMLASIVRLALQRDELATDELLSIVSHELSTPLAVIGGHAELLADRLRGADDEDAAGAIGRSISNLDDLLRTLSGLGQALGGPATRATIDLVPFLEQSVHDLAPLLAGHDVVVETTDDTAFASVEPVAVRQIVTNLLSNAAKFTAPGTRIDVAVRPGDRIHAIVVADHGPGIPPDREDELFGRYARLGATARGVGLGLHLARALARRQGGELRHDRTDGGGATFVLEVPA